MTINDIVSTLLELLQIVVSWPVVFVFALLMFRTELRHAIPRILSRLSERVTKATVGGTSFEFGEAQAIALKETIAEGAVNLRDDPESFEAFINKQIQKIVVPHHGAARAHGPLIGKKILWVDDHPENNKYEANLFSELGARIHFARSTKEALQQLDHGAYDLIITDVNRIEDGRDNPVAGFELITETETRDPYTPSIIYTSNIARLNPVRSAPASGAADNSRDLTNLVVKLIGRA